MALFLVKARAGPVLVGDFIGSGLTISIDTVLNGDTTLGDSSSDTLIINATISDELIYSATLNAATGNEVAYDYDITVNKATSGNYTIFDVNVTETSAPGASNYVVDYKIDGTPIFQVENNGTTTFGSTTHSIVLGTGDASITGWTGDLYLTSGDSIQVHRAVSAPTDDVGNSQSSGGAFNVDLTNGEGSAFVGYTDSTSSEVFTQFGADNTLHEGTIQRLWTDGLGIGQRIESANGSRSNPLVSWDVQSGDVWKVDNNSTEIHGMDSNGIERWSVEAGITASTTQSQGQQPLTKAINEISTVGNPNDVVTLPSAVAGAKIIIINNGANTLQIFPASGDDIDGTGVNSSVTLAAGSKVMYYAYDATNWVSV